MDAARLASPERPRSCTIRSASSKSARKDAPFALFVTSFLIGLNRIESRGKNYVGCKVSAYCSMPPNKRSSQLIWPSCLNASALAHKLSDLGNIGHSLNQFSNKLILYVSSSSSCTSVLEKLQHYDVCAMMSNRWRQSRNNRG
jgi:hypothetical protein